MNRGYDSIPYLKTIDEENGFFLCRIRKLQNPNVTFVSGDESVLLGGKECTLSDVLKKLCPKNVYDLDVAYNTTSGPLQARLILSWSKKEKTWPMLSIKMAN